MSIYNFDKWVPWITFGFYGATGLVVVLAAVRLLQGEEIANQHRRTGHRYPLQR